MGSLKEEWQQQRLQRQQDAVQRRQMVRESLNATQAELQQQAQLLRDDLALFRDSLMQNEVDRKLYAAVDTTKRQQERSQLQEQIQQFVETMQAQRQVQAAQQAQYLNAYVVDLQQQVQEFLRVQADERQQQAILLMQQLDDYVSGIQQQSAEFLAATAAERSRMGAELAQDLQQFHTLLTATVAAIRQDLQQQNEARHLQVQAWATQTQDLLLDFQDERILMQVQMSKNLADFMDGLRTDVSHTISQLHQERMAGAEQLSQQLTTFRNNLRSAVWGDGSPTPTPIMPVVVKPVAPTQPIAPKPAPQPAVKSVPVATAAISSTPKVASEVVPDANGSATKPASPESVTPTPALSPAATSPEQAAKNRIEQQVYDYVQTAQGARLAEIESAVGINRFQAVDALRSLMQRGAIAQHDRIYLAQKEVSL